MPEVGLNLSEWTERRRSDVGPYSDHIIHSVKAYEAEIQRHRDNEKFLRNCLADRDISASKQLLDRATAMQRALRNIRELNMTQPDENGHRWSNSELIEQEIVAALPASI